MACDDLIDRCSQDVGTYITCLFMSANPDDDTVIRDLHHTDVEFRFENEGRSLLAHKLVLAVRSPVFADLFYGRNHDDNSLLTITDFSYRSFYSFIQCIYYLYLPTHNTLLTQDYLGTLKAARHYRIPFIEEECLEVLSKFCSVPENVTSVKTVLFTLDVATYLGLVEIRDECLEILETRTINVLIDQGKPKKFAHQSLDVVLCILKRSRLGLSSESMLLEKVIEWIEHNNKKTENIDILLPYIDIMSLTFDEFKVIVEKYPSFFKDSDIESILMNLIRKGSRKLPEYCKSKVKRIRDSPSDEPGTRISHELEIKLNLFEDLEKPEPLLVLQTTDGPALNFEIKLSANYSGVALYLEKVELSFGPNDIREEDLKIRLFDKLAYDKIIRFWIQRSTRYGERNQYVLFLNNRLILKKGETTSLGVEFKLRKPYDCVKMGKAKYVPTLKSADGDLISFQLVSPDLVMYELPNGDQTLVISSFLFRSNPRRSLMRQLL